MKREDKAWQKIVMAARSARDERETTAPFGFASRVVALAFAGGRERELAGPALLERFSWRALGLAALLALVSVAANYTTFTASSDEDILSEDAAIASLFDVS